MIGMQLVIDVYNHQSTWITAKSYVIYVYMDIARKWKEKKFIMIKKQQKTSMNYRCIERAITWQLIAGESLRLPFNQNWDMFSSCQLKPYINFNFVQCQQSMSIPRMLLFLSLIQTLKTVSLIRYVHLINITNKFFFDQKLNCISTPATG